jgi:hypothetical protein
VFKIKWKVGAVPTGRYRSFQNRSWPDANYVGEGEISALNITCEEPYVPWKVRENKHPPLRVHIADYSNSSPEEGAFKWRRLKQSFTSLSEAKEAGLTFLKVHPEFRPEQFR